MRYQTSSNIIRSIPSSFQIAIFAQSRVTQTQTFLLHTQPCPTGYDVGECFRWDCFLPRCDFPKHLASVQGPWSFPMMITMRRSGSEIQQPEADDFSYIVFAISLSCVLKHLLGSYKRGRCTCAFRIIWCTGRVFRGHVRCELEEKDHVYPLVI